MLACRYDGGLYDTRLETGERESGTWRRVAFRSDGKEGRSHDAEYGWLGLRSVSPLHITRLCLFCLLDPYQEVSPLRFCWPIYVASIGVV